MTKLEYTPSPELRHLQNVLLAMVLEIDALCRKHGITYYLNGGNALGAVRHKGYIPWDDDFDIMLRSKDYKRFLETCRRELDPQKWYVQQGGGHDWWSPHSKIRLRGTFLEDVGEWEGIPKANRGIYIDVFELTNAPKNPVSRKIQYAASKLLVSYGLHVKGYRTQSFSKRTVISISRILGWKPLYRLTERIVNRYENADTELIGNFYGMSRYHNAFYPASTFKEPLYLPFEGHELPVPTDIHNYLTMAFGDYMTPPPADKQIPEHSLSVDFGKY